jgi:dipeptidyl aminopeptidase/acylaminoacyl peptidase
MRDGVLLMGLLLVAGSDSVSAETRTEDVTFVARCDRSTQHYVFMTPEGFQPDTTHHVLVALHGHGSDRWQFVNQPRDECRAARDAAAAHQMLFVAPDYRAKTSWMGPKAEADMVQIIENLKTRYRVGKVVLCGGSMGATATLTFAVLHPDLVDGVVAMNGTANLLEFDGFPEAIRESFGGSKTEIPEEYRRRSAEFWPERLKMPVALTAGGADRVVPAASMLRLAHRLEKLQPNVLLMYRRQGGHSTNYDDAKAAIEFVLGRTCGAISRNMVAPKSAAIADPRGTAVKELVERRNKAYAGQLEIWLRDYLVNQYPQRAAQAWHRDYSSIDAFLKSVEPNRAGWRKVIKPPELAKTGAAQRAAHPPLAELKAEWLAVPLGGLTAEGILVVPPTASPEKRVPLVVVQHGIGSFPERNFGVGDDGDAYHSYARRLCEAGFAVLTPMNLRSVEARNRIERLCRLADLSLPGIELVRMQRLLDEALADPRINAERVGMWGLSLGAFTHIVAIKTRWTRTPAIEFT